MLNPKSNRLDYGNLLLPPLDHNLESAVGTTYSLHFDALLGACMALGLESDTDSSLMDNSLYLLETLRRTSDKIVLFCQGGQIHLLALCLLLTACLGDKTGTPINRYTAASLVEENGQPLSHVSIQLGPLRSNNHKREWLLDHAGDLSE